MSPRRIEIKDPLLRVFFPLALSLLLLVYEVHALYALSQASRWPATTGHILSSSLQSGYRHRGVHLRYRYAAGGSLYTGRRLSYGRLSLIPFAGEPVSSIARRYPRGRKVTVHYDPDRPSRAVLETEAPFVLFLHLGLAVFLAVVTGASTLDAARRRMIAARAGESFLLPEQQGLFFLHLIGAGAAGLWIWFIGTYR